MLRKTKPTGFWGKLFVDTEEENYRVLLSLIDESPGAKLLDLGCHDGSFTMKLADRLKTRNIYGVELQQTCLESSCQKGIRVIRADLNKPLPFPDGCFDVIHANQVIEHLYDTDCFIAEIHRLLSKKGYAVVSTNNFSSLHNIVSLIFGCQPMPADVSSKIRIQHWLNPLGGSDHESSELAHLRLFSYSALKELLSYYGFCCEKYLSVGFYPFSPHLARLMTRLLSIYGAYLTCKIRPNPRMSKGYS